MEGGKQPGDEIRACLSYLQPSAPEENMELALRVVGNIAASGKSPFFIFATWLRNTHHSILFFLYFIYYNYKQISIEKLLFKQEAFQKWRNS